MASQLPLLASATPWSRSTPHRSSAMWSCSRQWGIQTVHCRTWACRHFWDIFGGASMNDKIMTRMCFSLQTFQCLFIISILSHIPNSNWEAAIQNAFTNSGHHYENTIQSVFLANKWSIYGKYSVLSVLHMSSIVFWQHDFSNDE